VVKARLILACCCSLRRCAGKLLAAALPKLQYRPHRRRLISQAVISSPARTRLSAEGAEAEVTMGNRRICLLGLFRACRRMVIPGRL
jgi:hypothetical protein